MSDLDPDDYYHNGSFDPSTSFRIGSAAWINAYWRENHAAQAEETALKMKGINPPIYVQGGYADAGSETSRRIVSGVLTVGACIAGLGLYSFFALRASGSSAVSPTNTAAPYASGATSVYIRPSHHHRRHHSAYADTEPTPKTQLPVIPAYVVTKEALVKNNKYGEANYPDNCGIIVETLGGIKSKKTWTEVEVNQEAQAAGRRTYISSADLSYSPPVAGVCQPS